MCSHVTICPQATTANRQTAHELGVDNYQFFCSSIFQLLLGFRDSSLCLEMRIPLSHFSRNCFLPLPETRSRNSWRLMPLENLGLFTRHFNHCSSCCSLFFSVCWVICTGLAFIFTLHQEQTLIATILLLFPVEGLGSGHHALLTPAQCCWRGGRAHEYWIFHGEGEDCKHPICA